MLKRPLLIVPFSLIGLGGISVWGASTQPARAVNLVRNAGFELDVHWNGTRMQYGDGEHHQTHARTGDRLFWNRTGASGWWTEGCTPSGVTMDSDEARTGLRSLKIAADGTETKAAVSAYDRVVEKGPVTLSAYVKTSAATGRLELDFNGGWRPVFEGRRSHRFGVDLPENSDWSRITVTADCPEKLEAVARLVVSRGTAWFDDVQIEQGGQATAFNVRPEEWLRLEILDGDGSRLPMWHAGAKAERTVRVYNDARAPLRGTVSVFFGPWDQPTRTKLTQFSAADLPMGQFKDVSFTSDALPPDAYVAAVTLMDDGRIILDGPGQFEPHTRIGGVASASQMRSRLVVRFLIAAKFNAGDIFGVGNGMLISHHRGGWFQGHSIENFVEARDLGVVCSRGPYDDDVCYLTAAAGIPIHAMGPHVDEGPPAGSAFANPANPGYIDVYHPEGLAFFKERAEELGRQFAANPMIASFQMHNEAHYIHGGQLCPSRHADAHFRRWCQARHGDLETLNRRWGTEYSDWAQVEQIVSARFVEEEKNRPKVEGAAAIDWTASFRALPERVQERLRRNPGWAMDWLRWRTETTLSMYATFRRHAKRHDAKTLYSNNLPWPNFFPQMFMPFIRAMDVTMLDMMYTSGWPKALGNPYEMIEILEMAESTQREKLVWGIEIYVQPSWPGEFAGLQNWAMVAHGMTNNLVFAWKPYSDHGDVEGTRAWEKGDAHPMWFMIDNDGTKLPHFFSYQRSLKEIAEYHRRFNGFSIKRVPTDIALYVSSDTAEYVMLETGEKPWGCCWTRTRNNLTYVLRLEGITADFVDDATLPETPGRFRTIIVPASYVLNQEAAKRLATFAKAGGTVVLAGASGICDPWLNKYECLGGPAWSDLNWRADAFTPDFAHVGFAADLPLPASTKPTAAERPPTMGGPQDITFNEGKTFRGVKIGTMAGAEAITDAPGKTVGWQRPWGTGRLIAYGVFPDTYVTNPHPSINITHWVRQMMELADLKFTARWVGDGSLSTAGHLGTGQPVVEVVVRVKSPVEKFVFCFNQGGEGSGALEVPVADGNWYTEDVISGEKITSAKVDHEIWRMPTHLKPWEYRVLRLVRQ